MTSKRKIEYSDDEAFESFGSEYECGDSGTMDNSKRDHHNKLERQRREHLRNEFQEMETYMSEMYKTGGKMSRETVLNRAAKYFIYRQECEEKRAAFDKDYAEFAERFNEYTRRCMAVYHKNFPAEMHFAALRSIDAEFKIVGMQGNEYFQEEKKKMLEREMKLPVLGDFNSEIADSIPDPPHMLMEDYEWEEDSIEEDEDLEEDFDEVSVDVENEPVEEL